MDRALTIIESCSQCGLCCEHIGVPPFVDDEYDALPPELQWSDEDDRRGERDVPCLWYDPESKQCSQYRHRPQICRDFEMGGDGCRAIRNEYGLS